MAFCRLPHQPLFPTLCGRDDKFRLIVWQKFNRTNWDFTHFHPSIDILYPQRGKRGKRKIKQKEKWDEARSIFQE
jgi:hypothetical protein